MKKKTLSIIKDDPWLEPFEDAIVGRHNDFLNKEKELTGGDGSLVDFANAHNYYGLHHTAQGWVLREWAPNATDIFVIGQFNSWRECAPYHMKPVGNGNPQHRNQSGQLLRTERSGWETKRGSALQFGSGIRSTGICSGRVLRSRTVRIFTSPDHDVFWRKSSYSSNQQTEGNRERENNQNRPAGREVSERT